jgi:hypothetical protein
MPAETQSERTAPPLRRLMLPLGLASLLAGLWAGLGRLGWALPQPNADLLLVHGPLMISGFFGTLIGLERAAALDRRWVHGGPLLTGLGGVLLVQGASMRTGAALIAGGSAVLLAASLLALWHQRTLFRATLALGGAAWLVGNLLWLAGREVPTFVLWWALFLLFSIAGARLEPSRLQRPTRPAQAVFVAALAVLLAAALVSLRDGAAAWPVAGFGLLGLALWLARYDSARSAVKLTTGRPRFTAISLLSGYVWLAVAGLCAIGSALHDGAFAYDAMLHALFLGFVFSVLFGHAPIVLPAVTRTTISFHRGFYAHLVLLHGSLLLRLAGDGLDWQAGRLYGGLLNAAALLLFLLVTGLALRAGRKPAKC